MNFQNDDSRGWHLWYPFLLGAGALALAHPAPEAWEAKALLYWALPLSGIWWWQINAGIVIRKAREARDSEPEPKQEEEFEPVQPPPFYTAPIKSDGKMAGSVIMAQVVSTPKMDKARYIAFTLCRQHQNNFPVDLTEETWAKNNGKKKKFCTRRELNQIKADWEADGAIYRLSGARNAKHDVLDWKKMSGYASGKHPLPR